MDRVWGLQGGINEDDQVDPCIIVCPNDQIARDGRLVEE